MLLITNYLMFFSRWASSSFIVLLCSLFLTAVLHWPIQWSFRRTGTQGTLASQAKIGVWVQSPGTLMLGSAGYHPVK